MKWDGLHLKMTRCAVELLVVGEESKQNYSFFFFFCPGEILPVKIMTCSVCSLVGGRLHRYGEVL